MNPKSILKVVFLLLFQISLHVHFIPFAMAQDTPLRVIVQLELDAINGAEYITAAQRDDQDFLIEALRLLDDIEQEQAKFNDTSQRLQILPFELKEIRSKFDAFTKNYNPAQIKLEYSKMRLETLTQRHAELISDLQNAQDNLYSINVKSSDLKISPIHIQANIRQAYQRSQDIRLRLIADHISNAEVMKLNIELNLLRLLITNQEWELSNRTNLTDLILEQQRYQLARINAIEEQLVWLQEQIRILGFINTERTEMLISNQNHPLIYKAVQINSDLEQKIIDAAASSNKLAQKNIETKGLIKHYAQIDHNLNEQIRILKDNLVLPKLLFQRYQQLASSPFTLDENLGEQIADLQLSQLEISQQRNQLSQKAKYLSRQLANNRHQLNEEEKIVLSKLLDVRMQLLAQLNYQFGNNLATAINLQLAQQQLIQLSTALKLTLQQNLFWVPNSKPIDSSWFANLPKMTYKQISNWVLTLDGDSNEVLLWPVALLLFGCLLLMVTKRLSTIFGGLLNDPVRKFLYAIVHSLPYCIFIISIGIWLSKSGFLNQQLTAHITFNLVFGYFIFNIYLFVMCPRDIGISQFRSSEVIPKDKYICLSYLWLPLLLLIMLSTKAVAAPPSLDNDIIGQALTLLLLGLTIYLILRISLKCGRERRKLFIALSAVPMMLIALITLGYYYTTLKLINMLIGTFYLIIIWDLSGHLIRCSSSMATYCSVSERESRLQVHPEGGKKIIERSFLNLKVSHQRTLRLIKMSLFLLLGIAFYWLWSDLIAVFTHFDSIVLWHKSDGGSPISLGNVLAGFFLFGVIFLLARNLPILLDVLGFSKLQLPQGVAYAFTTMLNYLLVGGGGLTALSMIGMPWDKLQWLAAGLMVGIGFGLQEVVGNFIAGIIILFERPVRIGDTITVGDFSGIVSKIRIRATTITDFDHKEMILPNKALMTERLTNWSLNDTVTRIVVRVGVSHGSDLELTRHLLIRAAQENARVLKEPEPLVYFVTFGSSTLDHELYVFVSNLIDRTPTVDELNRRIDELFRENGIKVAFNRVDINVKK